MLYEVLPRHWLLIALSFGLLKSVLSVPACAAAPARCDEPVFSENTDTESEEDSQAFIANERFLALLRRQPRPGTALERVYAFHVERGTLDEFIRSLKADASFTENDPAKISSAWMLLGLMEFQRGHDSEAAAALREAEARRPEDPLASWILGRSLERLGQADAAAEAMERAIQRSPGKSDLLQIFQELGRVYRRSQQPEKATEIWKRMEKLFPGDVRVKEQIAAVLYEDGDLESALPRFTELSKLHRDPYKASQCALMAGELKMRLGQNDEALKDFETQLEKFDPDSWIFRDTRRRIEQVFLRREDHAGLITYYETWLKSHREDLDAMSRIARALALQGRVADARGWYARALERAPSNVALRKALIEQLIREDQISEAISQYEQLHRFDNGDADHVAEWGLLYLRRSDLSKVEQQSRAAATWKLMLKDRPDDPVVLCRVADLLRQAKLTDAAIELYRRAIALAPEEPQYREYLGEFFHDLRRTEDALAMWTSVAEGDQKTTVNLRHLSELLQRFGYKDRAIAAIRSACELNPEFADRIQFARMLREYERYGMTPGAEESLLQLNLAEPMAETADDRQLLLQQRILSLTVVDLLESKTAELANELRSGVDSTALRWMTLALYYDAGGRLPDAVDAIRQCLSIEPDSVSGWTVAAGLYEKIGRIADAANANRRLAAIDPRSLTGYLKKVASLELLLGRNREAQQAGKDLVAAAPGNPEHLKFYADLCFQLGEKEEGLSVLRRSVRANSSDENAVLALAQALENQMEASEAIELYWRALEAASDTDTQASIASSLANLYLRTSQFDRLINRLELRAREIGHEQSGTLCLAAAYRVAGDSRSAREALEGFLPPDSRDVAMLTDLSRLSEEEGDVEAAADYQRRINSESPSPEGRRRLANLLLTLGEISEAEALWIRLAESSEPHEIFHSIDQLIGAHRIDVAQQLCDRVLEREPENWEAILRLGLLEWRYGQRPRAMEWFESLLDLKIDPDTQAAEAAFESRRPGGHPPRFMTGGAPAVSRLQYASTALELLGASQDFSEDLIPRGGAISGGGLGGGGLGGGGLGGGGLGGMGHGAFFGSSSSSSSSSSGPSYSNDFPEDFGEARVVGLAAQWLQSQQSETAQEDPERIAKAAKSTPWRWDMITAARFASLSSDGGMISRRLLDLLADKAAAGDVEAMTVYLMAAAAFVSRSYPANTNAGQFRVSEKTQFLSAQAELLISSYETVLTGHPEWLGNFRLEALIIISQIASRPELIDGLVSRLSGEDAHQGKLVAALELSLLRHNIETDDALQLLEKIDLLQQPMSGNVAANTDLCLSYLGKIATQSAANSDLGSVLKTLEWWVQRKARNHVRRQHPDSGATYINQLESRAWLPVDDFVTTADTWFLRSASGAFQERERQDELMQWCQRQRGNADAPTAFYMDLLLANLTWRAKFIPETSLHLIHAAEFVPDSNSLRMLIVELCQQSGHKAEALALLEKVNGSDPALLRVRELKVLDLAMQTGDSARSRIAAERLFGMALSSDSEKILITNLRKLGMSRMAEQVQARSETPQAKTKTTAAALTPMDLLDLYEKQGNTQAADQIAQRLLRRTAVSSAPSFRSTQRIDPAKLRARAFEVLKKSGELERMIERQKSQLEKSPHSRPLLRTLAEYLDVAGKYSEADEFRKKMPDPAPGSRSESIELFVEELVSSGQTSKACDRYLGLLITNPDWVWEHWSAVIDLFESEMRLAELADTIIQRNVRTPASADLEFADLIQRMGDDSSLRAKTAEFLRYVIKLHPQHTIYLLSQVTDDKAWHSPELFEVLAQAYLPSGPDSLWNPDLAWPKKYELPPSQFVSDYRAFNSGGSLQLLSKALTSEERRGELRDRVLAAQKAHPQWPAANVFYILIALNEPNSADEVEWFAGQLTDDRNPTIPEPAAYQLACLMSRISPRMRSLSIDVLRHSLDQKTDEVDLGSFAAVQLLELCSYADQLEAGREFVLNHMPDIADSSGDSIEQIARMTRVRLTTAFALAKVSCPIEALRMFEEISTEDLNACLAESVRERYRFSGQIIEEGSLKTFRAAALRAITPDVLTMTLQRYIARNSPPERGALDLAISVSTSLTDPRLESSTLDAIGKSSDSDAVRALGEKLDDALSRDQPENSLVVAALWVLLKSNDGQEIAALRPSLEKYLNRALPEKTPGTTDADFLLRESSELALACLVASAKTNSALTPLAQKMIDRSCATARQLSDKRYLSAILFIRGEWLMASGDKESAEAAWNEMLDLIVSEPEPRLNSRVKRPDSGTRVRAAVDIGEVLRNSLLKTPSP